MDRKLSVARIKALSLLGDQLGMFGRKRRVAALRSDQRSLIWRHDPELAEMLWLVPEPRFGIGVDFRLSGGH